MQFFIAIVTVIGFLGVVYHKVLKPFIEVQNAAADLIRAQLTKNSGSSLLDKVDSNIRKLNENHEESIKHWKTLQIADSELSTRMQSLEKKIGDFCKDCPKQIVDAIRGD